MSRRVNTVRYELNPQRGEKITVNDLKAILRGADSIIATGGRGILAKMLKGSKDKKIFEHELEKNPAYGYFKDLTLEEITAKIDWVIVNRYLGIEYSYRLPVLIYTERGWEIEMDTYTDELLRGFDEMIRACQTPYNMSYLKDRNREMILLLLDKVEATGNPKYIPILEAWQKIDYRKVRERIGRVIRKLKEVFEGKEALN